MARAKFTQQELKDHLCKLNFARSFLYIAGFLTEATNDAVRQKILKFQDKHKIEVSRDDLERANLIIQKKKY